MNEGAENLVDLVLPDVPIRQWVLTLPFPLRFPLAWNAKLLGDVLRIFTDTVAAWYRQRQAARGIPDGECGAVTVIQRASSDLRLNPHFHTLFLDGVYAPNPRGGGAPIFHPAPGPTQQDVEHVVHRARRRILRFLERRGVIAQITAPGDGEITCVVAEDLETGKDPLLAVLLAAAAAGVPPAGPAHKRAPVRIVVSAPGGASLGPVAKGKLVAQDCGFNLHAATRVPAGDVQGRATLCRYILRPPVANDRLHILPDGNVQLDFKRAWSDGTRCVVLKPLALVARLAALVPAPRRHITRYFGVLSSHSRLRSQVVPVAAPTLDTAGGAAVAAPADPRPAPRARYIPWAELLRRTFGGDVACAKCGGSLRLIALVKTEATIKKILAAMHLADSTPGPASPRPPPSAARPSDGNKPRAAEEDCLN
jgi:hypothetical protein